MLRTRLPSLSKFRIPNFQPPPSTRRTFITPTRPLARRRVRQVERPESVALIRKHRSTTLLETIRTSVESTDDHDVITSLVNENLDDFLPHISSPHDVYEDVIRFLIPRCCLPAAAAVYERMVAEGFIPTPRLDAHMVVVALSIVGGDNETRDELLSTLHHIVKNPLFTNDDIVNLLFTMAELKLSEDTINTTFIEFSKSHLENENFDPTLDFWKRLLRAQARTGEVDDALATLAEIQKSDFAKGEMRRACTAFIAAIRDTRHWDREAINHALELMEQHGLQPSLEVFNALISYEVRTRSLHRPFTIYAILKGHPKFLPDCYTFGSLFNILNSLYNRRRRRVRRGRRLYSNIPHPRKLYKDMIDALVRHPLAPLFEVTTSVLNVVLRSFIFKRDYAGAFNVIRCFSAMHVPMNVKTYTIVYRHLINRITYGLKTFRKRGDDKWSDRFLSLPYPDTSLNPRDLASYELGDALASRLLDVSRRENFKLVWPLYISPNAPHEKEPIKYNVPTVENMSGADPIALNYPFHPVPLERLLRKAILAESDSMRMLKDAPAAHRFVSRMISGTKDEMLPFQMRRAMRKMIRERQMYELAYWL